MRTRFGIKLPSFLVHDTIFGEFFDDNVLRMCSKYINLLQVINISPKMDSATSISHMTWKF